MMVWCSLLFAKTFPLVFLHLLTRLNNYLLSFRLLPIDLSLAVFIFLPIILLTPIKSTYHRLKLLLINFCPIFLFFVGFITSFSYHGLMITMALSIFLLSINFFPPWFFPVNFHLQLSWLSS